MAIMDIGSAKGDSQSRGTDVTRRLRWRLMPRGSSHWCGGSKPGFKLATMCQVKCHACVAPYLSSGTASTGMRLRIVHNYGMQL